jgi:HEAT repeat protein/adenylate kinase family enzyme
MDPVILETLKFLSSTIAGSCLRELVKDWGKKKLDNIIEDALKQALEEVIEDYSKEKQKILSKEFKKLKKILGKPEFLDIAKTIEGKWDLNKLQEKIREKGIEQAEFLDIDSQFWQKLENKFKDTLLTNDALRDISKTQNLEKIAQAVTQLSQYMSQPTLDWDELRREYLNWIENKYKYIEFKGIIQIENIVTFTLDQLYVPLRAKTGHPQKGTTLHEYDRHEKEIKTLKEKEADFLSSTEIVEIKPIDELMAQDKAAVILGDPGSGKSTYLKYLAYHIASGDKQIITRLGLASDTLPLIFSAVSLAELIKNDPNTSITTNFLAEHCRKQEFPQWENTGKLLQKHLREGKLLVMMDGIDEPLANMRSQVVGRIENMSLKYPDNHYLVTSRIIGYYPLGGSFKPCTLVEFDSSQIEHFAENWFQALENHFKDTDQAIKEADKEKERFLKAVSHSRLQHLVSNPLLLSITALIHRQGKTLPNRRIELYNLISKTLIESWNKARNIDDWTIDCKFNSEQEVVDILAPLALWMHENKPAGTASPKELVAQIKKRLRNEGYSAENVTKIANNFIQPLSAQTAMLVELGADECGFIHLTFEEYYAALAICEDLDTFEENILSRLHQPRWQEVLRLALSWQNNKKVISRVVEAILNYDDSPFTPLCRNLIFVGQFLADGININYRLEQRIINDLQECYLKTDIGALQERLQEVFQEMQGSSYAPLLAQTFTNKIKDKATSVRQASAEALGRLGVREKEVVQALLCGIKDENGDVRKAAVEAIVRLGVRDKEVVQAMLRGIKDEDNNFRYACAEALGQLGVKDKEVVQALLNGIKDESSVIRRANAEALGWLGVKDKEIVQALLSGIKDEDWGVRDISSMALRRLEVRDKEVVQALLSGIKDEDWYVRYINTEALADLEVKDKEVVQALLNGIKDEDWHVRKASAYALANLGVKNKEVVQALLNGIKDEDWYVRYCSAEALGQLRVKDKEVVLALLSGIKDEDNNVRYPSAEALGRLGVKNKEVVQALLYGIKDEDWYVRYASAMALRQLEVRDKEVVLALLSGIKNKNINIRSLTYDALEQLANMEEG